MNKILFFILECMSTSSLCLAKAHCVLTYDVPEGEEWDLYRHSIGDGDTIKEAYRDARNSFYTGLDVSSVKCTYTK